ncbi:MAG: hypothetical protein EAZ97_04975 [Bacteroidetes bacterium]|nr:MAG: hypothetical protein EAZ97_04975 [Bacteroidota bacterium]
MGLHLSFYTNFQHLDKSEWENAYQETLTVLKKFPIPLVCLTEQTVLGKKRHVWSSKLVKNTNKANEHWSLEGDLWSSKTGETFKLYRHMIERMSGEDGGERVARAFSEHSVFHSSTDYDFANAEFGVGVFGGWDPKTQGYPFHLAILAACMVLENHFEGRGYVFGDFDMTQAQEMQKWLSFQLKREILLPVCLDPQRLWKYLRQNNDEKHAIERFITLIRLDPVQTYRALSELVDRKTLFETLAKEMNSYSEISQNGAVKIWSTVLEVWDDVDILLEFIEVVNQNRDKKEPFELAKLLKALCNDYVSINPILKENLDLLKRKKGDLTTVEDSFTDIMALLGGMKTPNLRVYIPKEEIWEAFMAKDPINAALYREILDKAEEKNLKDLEKINQEIAEIEEKLATQTPKESDSDDQDEKIVLESPEIDRYIVRQTLLQCPKFADLGDSLAKMGGQIRGNLKPNKFVFDTLDEYKQSIYEYSHLNGFALSDKTWEKIDQLEDRELLRIFALLSALKMDEMSAWKWRLYAFEHTEHWERFRDAK